MIVEPGDHRRAAERVVELIREYAVQFDPVDGRGLWQSPAPG
jgi:hypothetical protein